MEHNSIAHSADMCKQKMTLVLFLLCSLNRVGIAKELGSHKGFLSAQQSEEPYNNHYYIKLLPGIKHVIINVGSNVDPPFPPADNESIAVLAVEPVLGTAAKIAKHPRLYVICAAIADTTQFQSIYLYK